MNTNPIGIISDTSLLALHDIMQKALDDDDKIIQGPKIFGIREFPDSVKCIKEIEIMLSSRGLPYEKINV